MIGLIQVVTKADVKVDEQIIGQIDQGILALIGIEKTDTNENAQKLMDKMINYRIFKDADGKTNLSLKDIQGGLLLVPQFTLVAEMSKGLRPGFSRGMPPAEGKILFQYLTSFAKQNHPNVETGEFGAYMHVSLCNDGPMTFILTA
jgi:D-tyrosyl-tRNA(Tyr) deacylase